MVILLVLLVGAINQIGRALVLQRRLNNWPDYIVQMFPAVEGGEVEFVEASTGSGEAIWVLVSSHLAVLDFRLDLR